VERWIAGQVEGWAKRQ